MHFSKTFTPAAANANGFATAATGASWPLTATVSGDGLAHQVTITNNSATDESGKTAVITGTDADGVAQSETITLPAASVAVTSVGYYSSVTSIVPSATIGVVTVGLGWAATATTFTLPVNYRNDTFQLSSALQITGVINVTVQETLSHMSIAGNSQSAFWLNDSSLQNISGNAWDTYQTPIIALRLLVNSVTAGATVKWQVVQGNNS